MNNPATIPADNPLSTPSDLPYGLPSFDRIRDEHFLSAFEAGIAEQAAEVAAIAEQSDPATFENTILALERSGRLLTRTGAVFFNLAGSHSTETLRAVHAAIAPKLAAHSDEIHLNPALFARVDELFARRGELGLDAESLRLLERYHRDYRRAGADLSAPDQRQLRKLNEELSVLATTFGDNLLADTNDLALLVESAEELAGLSDGEIAAAAQAATARGHYGKYLISLILPTPQPALASLENRAVRERLLTAAGERGKRGNDHDNSEVVAKMAMLRAERAGLLGYSSHAAYVIEDETAGSAEAAVGLLNRLAPVAVANAKQEAGELRELIAADGGGELAAWDWSFHAERVRKQRYEVDTAALRPYFELGRVLVDGVFHAANLLYGLTFSERHDLPTYHPDVRVFEVFDADGSELGLFLADYFTRDEKRGGAWMNNYVEQNTLFGERPVVVNNLNIVKPPAGEPALLTLDEVTTLFHEFGHTLHGLLSDVRYPTFSGANVPRDFVEFPSQVNEMWLLWPEVLANYARHHETGEALPADLGAKLLAAQQYGEGHDTTSYLAAALLDQAWHAIGPEEKVEDVQRFQAEALAKAGVALDEVVPRYRSTYFKHIFGGGYSAGYYSYIWSQVLDADTVEWFKENGGASRENGDRFRRELLSRGGAVDPMAAFRAFRGRDPRIEPLLERLGLTGA